MAAGYYNRSSHDPERYRLERTARRLRRGAAVPARRDRRLLRARGRRNPREGHSALRRCLLVELQQSHRREARAQSLGSFSADHLPRLYVSQQRIPRRPAWADGYRKPARGRGPARRRLASARARRKAERAPRLFAASEAAARATPEPHRLRDERLGPGVGWRAWPLDA